MFGVAADHLYEYGVDGYRAIPTIGPLFLLNGIGAIAIGVVLVLPLGPILPARLAGRFVALAAIAGILLASSSLAGLFVSEATPLFGFMEIGYRAVVVLAIVAEGSAIVFLGALLIVGAQPPTVRSGIATMLRRRSIPNEGTQR